MSTKRRRVQIEVQAETERGNRLADRVQGLEHALRAIQGLAAVVPDKTLASAIIARAQRALDQA